jgi:hypothetical protein
MKYTHVQELSGKEFRRRTGVKKNTFATMAVIVKRHELIHKKISGRPSKLSIEDRILMSLEYLREYRTYLHIAHDYGISESNCFKIIRKVEDTLIASKQFALPKRQRALSDHTITATVVDCTESPIERPQKNSVDTTRERKNVIHSKHSSSLPKDRLRSFPR